MLVYKDGARNTWYVKFKHKNWKGESKWVTKRGFKTKREATQWERDFEAREDGSLDMTFAEFVKVYRKNRNPRIKERKHLCHEGQHHRYQADPPSGKEAHSGDFHPGCDPVAE